jgi:predicted O-methyltransferase YrrM
MIVDERMVAYINSLDVGNSALVNEIEEEALATYVPIIRKEMQNFLKVILEIKRPKAILEVGTAIGFSALLMSEHVDEDCHITTIEKYEPRIPIAKENLMLLAAARAETPSSVNCAKYSLPAANAKPSSWLRVEPAPLKVAAFTFTTVMFW